MRKIFTFIALFTALSSLAFADTTDKWAGSWRPLDPVFGEMTMTLTQQGAGYFRLTVVNNGKTMDYGGAHMTKEPSGLSGSCGPLTTYTLAFEIAGNDQADFSLNKHYCPDGSVYGKVNHLNWSYDTVTSSDNGKWKDVMMMATLKFVE